MDAARHLGTAPQDDKPAAQRSGCVPASWRWLCVCLAGLALYPEPDLERLQVQVRFGQQFLEPGVLDFKVLQAPGLVGFHAAVLGTPLVERGFAESALAADLLDRQARLGLLQEPNDLLFGKSTRPHVRHSPGWRTSLPFNWYGYEGAGQLLCGLQTGVLMGFRPSARASALVSAAM